MAVLQRVAPAFPVTDVRASLAHYERLGFATREYVGGDYGYATRDGIEIHLGLAPPRAEQSPRHSAYVWVDASATCASTRSSEHTLMSFGVAWTATEGREVKSIGDGLMVVFGGAADALACAVEMQQSIAAASPRSDSSESRE